MARENRQARHERRFGRPQRLIDRINIDGLLGLAPILKDAECRRQYEVEVESARSFLGWAKVIDAKNVAEYARTLGEEKEGLSFDDLPLWLPPFESMFIEFRTEDKLDGVLVCSSKPDENGDRLLTCWYFLDQDGEKQPLGPLVRLHVLVGEHGEMREYPCFQIIGYSFLGEKMIETIAKSNRFPTYVAFLTISLMTCKNVSIDTHEPDRQLNNVRQRHGLRPLVRYHTINIEPMKRVLKTEGQAETEGLKRALHICRGHFATYSEEKPLFGRVAGTFWVPAHVRGQIKEGVVFSDYKVHAP